jgi:hypothetical protein
MHSSQLQECAAMNMPDPSAGRGDKRAFRLAAVVVALLIVVAVVLGVLWLRKPAPDAAAVPASGPTVQDPRPATQKAPGS